MLRKVATSQWHKQVRAHIQRTHYNITIAVRNSTAHTNDTNLPKHACTHTNTYKYQYKYVC